MQKHITFRHILLTLILCAALFTLASCKGSLSRQNTEAPRLKDPLTIWAWDESFNIAAAKTAKEFYLKEHPDADIEIVTVAQDDIVAMLYTRFSAGAYDDLPDIVLIEDYRIQGYLHTYANEFADLSDIAVPDDFASYKTEMNQFNGKMYGIPFDCGVAALFYRTDYIKQAGYSKKDMENLTWERYIEIGKEVKEKTGKYMLTLNPGDLGQIRMMLQSAGSWYTDEDGNPNVLENDVLKEAIRTYKKIVDSGIATYVGDWGQFIGIKNSVNASSLGGGGWYVLKNAGHEQEAKQFLQETFASDVTLMDRLAGDIELVSTLKAAKSAPNYSEGVAFFGGQKIFKDFIRWVKNVPTVNYGEDTYEIEDNMTAALQKIIDGIDMEVVLESTFAATITAAPKGGGQ